MVSVNKDSRGWRIRFVDGNGKQRTLRPGKLSKAKAESIGRHVDELASAKASGQSIDRQSSLWLDNIGDALQTKLANLGLIEPRASSTLGKFIEEYIAGRTVKLSTSKKWTTTKNHLLDYFPDNTPLRNITAGDSDNFREHLYGKGQEENTVRRYCGVAKQFFRAAQRRKLIEENPFADQVATVIPNHENFYFVTREVTAKLLEASPDWQWRAIIVLTRFGGLRCPSEVLALKWTDLDWAQGRFRATSPKTEHHEGGASRITPLFPEMHDVLREGQEMADDQSEYVITRYRDPAQNLRTTFAKIIKRAMVDPWPKPFQNIRSTRETELAEEFPLHVVTKWLGNSEAVARRHYLQTTEEHFLRAISITPDTKSADGGLYCGLEEGGNGQKTTTGANKKSPKTMRFPGSSRDYSCLPFSQNGR